ncbi:glycosyltransferase family 2 protein [Arthrobacter crystallopoietes]|uniref:N-acetylglucosaminyl-diphospho-decaprenol L-rhamnosyltransferase n=1 Tax=Crystallibacter crystallopoietes TaxID=37928 RepID=A0A1H0ZRL5_9MICC|nr:glycosyltransferase family 2 protein [Arthrobacter crystallopoietes]AUI51857.1 hypothetical protein AC20117_14730 [Arthrobacter crystallopoietes]SDQ29861.1 N-acetylglucosaminyl-diphospho-decaprenol L-rhamnosyltransferase [Arthrobacter crystallopoietes]
MSNIHVVIVTYNSNRYLKRLAQSVREAFPFDGVVIVDNNSADNSVELARELDWGAPLSLIFNRENTGFGAAMNIGVRSLPQSTDYVLLVNPDVELDRQAIRSMWETAESDDNIGCVGAQLVTSDGSPVSSARELPTILSVGMRKAFDIVPQPDQVLDAGWICGALMLWRYDKFLQLGGFSPDYFLYFEDTDICRKAHNFGIRTVIDGGSKAIHDQGHGERPHRKLRAINRRSRYLYAKKWLGLGGRFSARIANCIEIIREVGRD